MNFPHVEVRPHNGAPALFIEGIPTFPLILMTASSAIEQWKSIQTSDIHLLTDTFPLCWIGIDKYDFSAFDAMMENYLQADPEAMLMPRIHLDAPEGWMDAHPDELVGYADEKAWEGDTSWGGARHPNWASQFFLKDSNEALRRLMQHVASQEYSARIFGWHLGSGIYGEWHYWNAVYYPDTSPAFANAYREWLTEKYPDQEIEARIPTIEDRRHGDVGMFRDPLTSNWMNDWAEFFHLLGAKSLAEYARIVKEETQNHSIVLAFNGYLPDLDVNHEIDHRAFEKTLRDDDVNCFSSPHSYARRAPGDDATMRGFMGSVRAMGKLWIDEADERTHLAAPTQWKHVANVEETVEVLWRSFAQALTHNCGLWFMDQGALWGMPEGTWYQDEKILHAFSEMKRVGEESMKRERTRVSEVAVVSSYKTAFHLADRSSGLDNVTNTLINPSLEQFTKCGAPFDLYLLPELFEPTVPQYKVFAFLDTFFLTDEELKNIQALRDSGKTLLFFYAPGFLSENGISLERMRDLLGMDLQQTDSIILPDSKTQTPGFIVPGEEGQIAQSGNVFYCAAPPLPADALRRVLQSAGVHTYLDSNDPLMVGGGYIAVHATDDGEKIVHNPLAANWVDVRSEEILAQNVTQLSLEMKRGETIILSVQ